MHRSWKSSENVSQERQEQKSHSCRIERFLRTTVFDYSILQQRFREMAFLTKGLKIVLRDERPQEPMEKTFHYEGGIKEFVDVSEPQ